MGSSQTNTDAKLTHVKATLTVTLEADFNDNEATEETLRYCVEQDLEDLNYDNVEVSVLRNEVVPHRNYGNFFNYWCACGWHLGRSDSGVNYCARCGKKVKWDD